MEDAPKDAGSASAGGRTLHCVRVSAELASSPAEAKTLPDLIAHGWMRRKKTAGLRGRNSSQASRARSLVDVSDLPDFRGSRRTRGVSEARQVPEPTS